MSRKGIQRHCVPVHATTGGPCPPACWRCRKALNDGVDTGSQNRAGKFGVQGRGTLATVLVDIGFDGNRLPGSVSSHLLEICTKLFKKDFCTDFMGDFHLFHCIDGLSVEVVYIIETWDVFSDEGLLGLYSCPLCARVRLGIGGSEVGYGRYDGHCR